MTLNQNENIRYSRHLNLPQFDKKSQEKLKTSKVLVVGAGGLAAPVLQYLTAAGIGTIGVIDADKIEESNLQRQVLFDTSDIGKYKSERAVSKLKKLNPYVDFIVHKTLLNTENAIEIIKQFDIIVDGTDNFPTRYLINDACLLCNKPFVYASIYQFEAQLSVFNFQKGPNYRDLFPSPPSPDLVQNCEEGGVLGVLPGIVGSIQAAEVIKIISGIGEPLSGKLLLIDALNFEFRKVNIQKDPENPVSGHKKSIFKLIDYDIFCGIQKINNLSVKSLHDWNQKGAPFKLIDVREKEEFKISHLEAESIPLDEIENQIDKIPREGNVIFYCKSGQRSAKAISLLQKKYDYSNLMNLEGGIMAWKNHFDPDLIIA
ncbi:MAG: molybdopterin-synthase adenylyltransferase MoeB [Cytophagales bacterium]